MPATDTLTLLTSAAFTTVAFTLIAFEVERRLARHVLAAALQSPQTVEKAWVSPPDESGLRCLYVKAVGAAREHTVAIDHEVDEVVRRFSLAGIRIGYEEDATA